MSARKIRRRQAKIERLTAWARNWDTTPPLYSMKMTEQRLEKIRRLGGNVTRADVVTANRECRMCGITMMKEQRLSHDYDWERYRNAPDPWVCEFCVDAPTLTTDDDRKAFRAQARIYWTAKEAADEARYSGWGGGW